MSKARCPPMGDAAATGARETLKQLTSALHNHLGSDLHGLYLFGSLAAGAFYPGKSDLDLMAIVAAEVEEGQQLESLRSLHDAFVSERPAWVERVEVAYVDRGVLRTFGDRPSGRIAVINPGEPLHIRDVRLRLDPRLAQRDHTGRDNSRSSTARSRPGGQPRCLQAGRGSPAERVAEQSSCAVGRLRSRAPGLRGDDALPRPLRSCNRRADDKGGGSRLGRSQIPRVVELYQRSPSDLPRRCA